MHPYLANVDLIFREIPDLASLTPDTQELLRAKILELMERARCDYASEVQMRLGSLRVELERMTDSAI